MKEGWYVRRLQNKQVKYNNNMKNTNQAQQEAVKSVTRKEWAFPAKHLIFILDKLVSELTKGQSRYEETIHHLSNILHLNCETKIEYLSLIHDAIASMWAQV